MIYSSKNERSQEFNRWKKLTACALMAGSLLLVGGSTSNTSSNQNNSSADNTSQNDSSSSEDTKDDVIDLGGTTASSQDINLNDYDGNVIINKGGIWYVTGSLNGSLIVDAKDQDVTIELDSASISASDPALYIRKAKNVTLKLTGENSMSDGSTENSEVLNACLYSKADLVIEGDGSLNIVSQLGHGIKAKDSLKVTDASMNISAAQDGIHINEDAEINANITITSQDEGIQSEQALTISGGSLAVQSTGDCLRAETTLNAQAGDHVLVSTENEGLESKDALYITGGSWDITAYDDGINAAKTLQIDDGVVAVYSQTNDGIDSNGSMIFNGGTITALSRQSPEGAFDTDNTAFEINGGTIIGIGPMGTYPTAEKQNVLMIGGSGRINSIELLDASGNVLMEFSDEDQFLSSGQNALTFSSPAFEAGMEIQVVINGNAANTVTLEQGLTTLGTIPSMGGMGGGMQGGNGGPGMMKPGNGGFGGQNGDASGNPGEENPGIQPPDAELNPPIDRK